MGARTDKLRLYLHSFDFQNLFVEELGWDCYRAKPTIIPIDGQEYVLKPVAQKAGFAVFECGSNNDGSMPGKPTRCKIERRVTKLAFEHLIIFIDANKTKQVWQWVKKAAGGSYTPREHTLCIEQTGAPLLQRLDGLLVTMDDELKGIGITDVANMVSKALDVDKVTKRFFVRFKKEMEAFRGLIDGMDGGPTQGDRDWYASLMLNRMMFVYFIQKQGFLNGDADYLRSRLHMVQDKYGSGRFQQFYRDFLIRLFHEGLGLPKSKRDSELHDLLGRVPYLNGSLFVVHELEKTYSKISIPDVAFERIFNFFDEYSWHLDERPRRKDNEINPDVIGFIFEKYINQKEMGAYYTKEDITGYIVRNTVIPFILDSVKKKCPEAFRPGGNVWRLLQDEPDHYIYPSMGHGIAWNYSLDADPQPLQQPLELPTDVTVGLNDVSQRGIWNSPPPRRYALPTETWREVVARRQHYQYVRDKLATGKVTSTNDLITLNVDIELLASKIILQGEEPKMLLALWYAINTVSVLDPTCGSGAFLFATLNVLEPLYTACLDGMRSFVADSNRSQTQHSTEVINDFQTILEQANSHPNQRYFILKSIVLNNLYGVDIMEEAVEICKLRLFLKLVAQLEKYEQIEPLPDIDFNIRAGNTLVGFTSMTAVENAMRTLPNGQSLFQSKKDQERLSRIKQKTKTISQALDQFRNKQTAQGGEVTLEDKTVLRCWLDDLREELDIYLAAEYGIDHEKSAAYDAWTGSHQPFHWLVEFYGIMSKGGFDVIIGNPPYVEYRKIKNNYIVKGYKTKSCGNLYAYVIERNMEICSNVGVTSMIVPHSAICTDRMAQVQTFLFENSITWVSTYDIRPAKLFGVDQRLSIYISRPNMQQISFSSRYHRWHEDLRPVLFNSIKYVNSSLAKFSNSVPKMQSALEIQLIEKLNRLDLLKMFCSKQGWPIYYHNAPRYWIRCTDYTPYFWTERDGEQLSSHIKTLTFRNKIDALVAVAVLNSSLFYWWFILLSNCRDLNLREIKNFPIGLEQMPKNTKSQLAKAARKLMKSFKENSQRKETRRTTGKVIYDEFNQKPSKHIMDEIDHILARHYGFTSEELDFIINYDIKYRMGWGNDRHNRQKS